MRHDRPTSVTVIAAIQVALFFLWCVDVGLQLKNYSSAPQANAPAVENSAELGVNRGLALVARAGELVFAVFTLISGVRLFKMLPDARIIITIWSVLTLLFTALQAWYLFGYYYPTLQAAVPPGSGNRVLPASLHESSRLIC